jgi:hypothetical protein
MTGSMVSSEAVLKLNGTSPRMADNKGPTAAIEGRRFNATNTTLTISQTAWMLEVRTFSITKPWLIKMPFRPGSEGRGKLKTGQGY